MFWLPNSNQICISGVPTEPLFISFPLMLNKLNYEVSHCSQMFVYCESNFSDPSAERSNIQSEGFKLFKRWSCWYFSFCLQISWKPKATMTWSYSHGLSVYTDILLLCAPESHLWSEWPELSRSLKHTVVYFKPHIYHHAAWNTR